MSITLYTGLPGSGKSLRAVDAIRKAIATGRNVYVDGIDGLSEFGWEPCDLRKWQDLPDGSLVVADEIQKRWPTRRTGDTAPEVSALSEHRHRGFDFVLVTQHPTMVDAYVRKLVDRHEHLVRQFKAKVSRVYSWMECYDDPQSLSTRNRSESSIWKYPSECFSLYKSATLHTMQAKIPKKLLFLPVLLVLVGVALWYGWRSVSAIGRRSDNGSQTTAKAASAEATAGATPAAVAIDATAYVAKLMPRVPGMPWSAPVFDDRKAKAEPEIYCVDSQSGCRCYTEQITRISTPVLQCLQIARYGVYNPFREPFDKRAPTSPADSQNRRDKPDGRASRSNAGFDLAGDDDRHGLKAGDAVGEASSGTTNWPHPDFSYKVPFPGHQR